MPRIQRKDILGRVAEREFDVLDATREKLLLSFEIM
jgi:hypothetical protein